MTNAPTDLVGQTLGPYAIEQLLGQGGFAWVFAAREKDGTPVAVKVLKPRYANDPQFAPRFRNEAKTASQLEHPNIIRIRAVGESDGHSYFSMDLCADGLGLRIAREGPLPEADLVRIGKDIAGALEFAHAQGIIHRDIKADNVLLRSDGSAVLTDFGIARTVSGYATSTGVDMTIGTPNYISPEQAQGRPVDPRADIYSLGVTLYKAATGEVPFTSKDWFELARMHVEDPPPPPRARRPDLSKRLERVIFKCLAKHPDDRYATATELLADLVDVEAKHRPTLEIGTPPPGTREQVAIKRPVKKRFPWEMVVLIVGGVVLAVLVAKLIRR
ncbi:MAG TPA: serine/threonine-protein kinase [Gemmatimonadales bacterium]